MKLFVFSLPDLKRAALVSGLCWSVSMLASVPHLLFTKINYIPFPYPDGPLAPESAFCAMLDIPSVSEMTELGLKV